jgi:thioredoxin-like negative regulator of GroEL
MTTQPTAAARDSVKTALQSAIRTFIASEGRRLINIVEQAEAGVTATVFNINTKTGKALVELHTPWCSRGKHLTTALMKTRAADDAGVSYWCRLDADEKKAARAKWFDTRLVTIQL